MKNSTFSFLLAAVLLFIQAQAHAQNLPSSAQNSSPAQEQAPYEVQLGSKFAETLLIHKEEPACQSGTDGVRVTGTVVIAITIDKNGKVSHTKTLSGPKIIRPLASATVRKYRYKPYLVKGRVKPGHCGGVKLGQLVATKLLDLRGRRAS